jgi:hypothetical protein
MHLTKGEMQRKYYLYFYILLLPTHKGLLSHYPVPLTLVFFHTMTIRRIHTVQPPYVLSNPVQQHRLPSTIVSHLSKGFAALEPSVQL